ncbi:MAG: aminotransferase class I/II-fold pyridoxal phosphate-dependent enzyme [Oscillospiraceae bacterium]|nr:aminotransferase class I/II-fold pyridoxal phosphate-dependent enzyme [Oscillospiraceae bacterium]
MKTNFDEIIDRRNTNSTSVEGFRQYIFHDPDLKLPYRDEELIRMWIADMEFATPDCIVEGIRRRLDRRIFGYTRLFSPEYYGVFSAWTEKMYGWTFPRGDLYICGGIIPALNELVGYATDPGDKVLIFTPSYTPFKQAADFHGRECVCSDLVDRAHNGYFEIDFDDFRAKAADPAVKLLIFCNPHNPTGRIWTEDELRAVGEIAMENGLLILSDEIHCDLLRSGRTHTPLAKLFPGTDRIITCMAPSKTFNTAGLHFSNIIIPNEKVRAGWHAKHNFNVNPLALAAATAAYEHGYDWLMELREYLDGNFALIRDYLAEHLPKAVFRIPEATYLGWVDIGAYLDERTEFIPLLFAQHAGVLLEGGSTMFVQNSDTYIRLNAACPRATLREGLRRICDLLNSDVR